jgi:hypothetical protein|tara:strand:+ start:603 stop:800 length:198 start_codon:yes stop_codon:yes gene_type:complete
MVPESLKMSLFAGRVVDGTSHPNHNNLTSLRYGEAIPSMADADGFTERMRQIFPASPFMDRTALH